MKLSYIELLGEKHPMCFSLAATEALTDEFGSLDAMQDALTCNDIGVVVRSVDKVLSILMKAGRIYAGAIGEPLPPALPGRPVDFIEAVDKNTVRKIFEAMAGDSKQTIQAVSKNAEATQDEAALRGSTTTEPAPV